MVKHVLVSKLYNQKMATPYTKVISFHPTKEAAQAAARVIGKRERGILEIQRRAV